MPMWKIAAVQMDCKLADRANNLETIKRSCMLPLRQAHGS